MHVHIYARAYARSIVYPCVNFLAHVGATRRDWALFFSECWTMRASVTSRRCCRCNRGAKCIRCACVRSDRPCSSCLPGDSNNCHNRRSRGPSCSPATLPAYGRRLGLMVRLSPSAVEFLHLPSRSRAAMLEELSWLYKMVNTGRPSRLSPLRAWPRPLLRSSRRCRPNIHRPPLPPCPQAPPPTLPSGPPSQPALWPPLPPCPQAPLPPCPQAPLPPCPQVPPPTLPSGPPSHPALWPPFQPCPQAPPPTLPSGSPPTLPSGPPSHPALRPPLPPCPQAPPPPLPSGPPSPPALRPPLPPCPQAPLPPCPQAPLPPCPQAPPPTLPSGPPSHPALRPPSHPALRPPFPPCPQACPQALCYHLLRSLSLLSARE